VTFLNTGRGRREGHATTSANVLELWARKYTRTFAAGPDPPNKKSRSRIRVNVMPARGGGGTPLGSRRRQTKVLVSRTWTSFRRVCPFHPPKINRL